MLGRAQVMTPEGARELAVYADNRDLTADWLGGVIKADEDIVYKNSICTVIGEFTDDDGEKYTELIVRDGRGSINFVNQVPVGNGGFRVEFKMG